MCQCRTKPHVSGRVLQQAIARVSLDAVPDVTDWRSWRPTRRKTWFRCVDEAWSAGVSRLPRPTAMARCSRAQLAEDLGEIVEMCLVKSLDRVYCA